MTPPVPAAASCRGDSDDWRLRLPEPTRRRLRAWMWTLAAMTCAVVVIGGITRLTDSGLSIVAWEPVAGAVPPLSDAEWSRRFEAYRRFPEYRQLRSGMTLGEFKVIFLWEYLHRLVARLIGLVFLVPFAIFRWSGRMPALLARRALALLSLGLAQGVMGWLMVRSGLVDRPSVSHYRLAAHLSLAMAILAVCVWAARDLAVGRRRAMVSAWARRRTVLGVASTGALLAIQVVWGALVAGLDAGRVFNTFPLMAGHVLPPGVFGRGAWLVDLVGHPAGVQWMHRMLGTLLALTAGLVWWRLQPEDVDVASRRFSLALLALIGAQYLLGVLTLVRGTPIALAAGHQATAVAIVGLWVAWAHHVRNLAIAPEAGREATLEDGRGPRQRSATGTYGQSGSEAKGEPVAAYAREREPPQRERYSHRPHLP